MANEAGDLDAAALETLRLLGPDPEDWVPNRDGIDHNVAVVGGGQTGLTFGFALRRAGIGRVTIIEAAPESAEAGIWLTRARMERLRTPKGLPGPELGLPGLGFRAWFEARHGRVAYDAFDRVARGDWAAYLDWYRRFLDIPVRYGTRLTRVEPAGDHFRLHLETPTGPEVETARKLILGTGFAGGGGPALPPGLRALPEDRRAHTADPIDFAALRGRTLAVVGAGASAFDAAATALEAGAAAVHLLARRDTIASVPVTRTRGYPGAYDNYPHLPDAIRWRQARRFLEAGSTPPPDAIARAVRHPNFHLHLGAPVTRAALDDDHVALEAGGRTVAVDFVIAGTGYVSDPSLVPELAEIAPHVLRWSDRHQPAPGEADARLGVYPYLGLAHEYLERVPGAAPYLKDIHVFNPQGFVSFGLPIGDIPSLRRDVAAVTARISRDLFLADLDHHEARIFGDIAADFDASLYADAVREPRAVAAE